MTPAEPRVEALRREATELLRPLADLAAPVAAGDRPPWDQLLRIREHEVDRAAACGASLVHDGEFDGWRAAMARRRLGLQVLERLRKGATADPAVIARDVVRHEITTSTSGLASWLATLGPGGTAAVVREATWFAVTTRLSLSAWPLADGTRFDDRFEWCVPGRAVRLEAAVDAVTRPTRSLLVLATADEVRAPGAMPLSDGARRDLSWPALVAALTTGQLPSRVTRIDLVSGERCTVPVTDDVLDDALTLAANAVEAAIAARFTSPLPPVGGRWCRACAARARCPASHCVPQD